MITAVGAIVHSSPQREELVRFYRVGLGLGDPDHRAGEDFFQVGDLHLGINSGDPRLPAPLPRMSLTFVVDDLDGLANQLRSVGVPLSLEPATDGSGARRATCRDPDGNFVVLLSGPRQPRAAKAHKPEAGDKRSQGRAAKVARAEKPDRSGKPSGKKAQKADRQVKPKDKKKDKKKGKKKDKKKK